MGLRGTGAGQEGPPGATASKCSEGHSHIQFERPLLNGAGGSKCIPLSHFLLLFFFFF